MKKIILRKPKKPGPDGLQGPYDLEEDPIPNTRKQPIRSKDAIPQIENSPTPDKSMPAYGATT